MLLAGPGVASAADTSREIAAHLRNDPVYVASSQRDELTPAERGRLRIRIARRDVGRIQMVVVAPAAADRAGGIDALANAVDQAMPGRPGSLVVTAGDSSHVITSHSVVQPTLAAVRRAFATHEGDRLVASLLAAVDGIAAVDPGAEGDLNQPSPNPLSGVDDTVDDVGDTAKLALLIVAGAVALPFLLFALFYVLRWRRRRAAVQDREDLALDDAREALATMAQEISDLDLDTEMPGASARGREDYARALDLYDRANKLLTGPVTDAELEEAGRTIAQGRAHLATAREELGKPAGQA
jgi:hypothetical protein